MTTDHRLKRLSHLARLEALEHAVGEQAGDNAMQTYRELAAVFGATMPFGLSLRAAYEFVMATIAAQGTPAQGTASKE